MSNQSNSLALVREHQNKSPNTTMYFSLNTALSLIMGKEPTSVFVTSFGDKPNLPDDVKLKHIPVKIEEFVPRQHFRLDSLLVSVKENSTEVIDKLLVIPDIANRVVDTVKDPEKVLDERPFLIIRAAAIIAETGFEPSPELFSAASNNARRLKYIDRSLIWNELQRFLRADTPSRGIDFLHRIGALIIVLPEVETCYGVEQNNKYHKYTVYEHCLMACDSCINTNVLLRLAALIHDSGKPATVGRNSNGITFHKHEVVSTKLAKNVVNRLGLSKDEADFVVSMVSNHMYQYDRVWKDTTIRKFIRRVGLTKDFIGRMGEFPLFQLRHADRMGRGLSPYTQKQSDFERRLEETLQQEEMYE